MLIFLISLILNLIQNYTNVIKKDENQQKFLSQAVDDYRQTNPDC